MDKESPLESTAPAVPLLAVTLVETGAPTATEVPLGLRLATDILKPKDWQALQRNCVLLFKSEFRDPNAHEYGRNGQEQFGIDILGRRNADPAHYVGVQCRKIEKPLTEEKILEDCRATLNLRADLKEIIFATTAPDDTKATDAAVSVEKLLNDEGRHLTVTVYGWGQLQTLIAEHPTAYAAFVPSSAAITTKQSPFSAQPSDEFVEQLASKLRGMGVGAVPVRSADPDAPPWADEDPPLHAKIDAYRDVLRDQHEVLIAEKGFLAIAAKGLEGRPWAQFRIETNLGSIALDCGRTEEAIARFEAAYALQPNYPTAIASLSLVRTLAGRYAEAMALAQSALEASPRADHAVAYLLQAAARSDWAGDPEDLIPADLVSSDAAAIGLAEFLRRREADGWEHRVIALGTAHPNADQLNRSVAVAVLSLAVKGGKYIPGGAVEVSQEEINTAANTLKEVAEAMLAVDFADEHDLEAFLNNAAVLLRLAKRQQEASDLLQQGLKRLPDHVGLRRLHAIVRANLNDRAGALAILAGIADPESQLFKAELASTDDASLALIDALAVEILPGSPLLDTKWRVVAELAFKVRDLGAVKTAVEGLRALDPESPTARLYEIDAERRATGDREEAANQLLIASAALSETAPMSLLHQYADQLSTYGRPSEAADLLEPHVALDRLSPASVLYLQALASSRRDTAFRRAIDQAAPTLANDPEILWTRAAHAWNLGDLNTARELVETLLRSEPDNAQGRLLKIEIALREDRSSDLLEELAKPIEDLRWHRLGDKCRIAALLGHFGFHERALAYSYRLTWEYRDNARAWMSLVALILDDVRQGDRPELDLRDVAAQAAVDLTFEDGSETYFVIEPDPELRKLDSDSWELDHPLVKATMGLRTDDAFTTPEGRSGKVRRLRQKYVARFHFILEHYEARFPTVGGFQRLQMNPEAPEPLDELLEVLKDRHEWFQEQEAEYQKGQWPIGLLAYRLGVDVVDVAGGLAQGGVPIRVANGNEEDRHTALSAIQRHRRQGCVLDLLTFWTAWKLEALDVVVAVCGPITVPTSVVDRLRARREKFETHTDRGALTGSYEEGRLVVKETGPDAIVSARDDIDAAIEWLRLNATVAPVVATDDLVGPIREFLQTGKTDLMDATVLAKGAGLLLVTDDQPIREWNARVGSGKGAWLHQVLTAASNIKKVSPEDYVRWSSNLIEAGQTYLGASSDALLQALRMRPPAETGLGRHFLILSGVLGGQRADPASHVRAAANFLLRMWADSSLFDIRSAATGRVLRCLVRERADYQDMLRALAIDVQKSRPLLHYLGRWAIGHFIPNVFKGLIRTR